MLLEGLNGFNRMKSALEEKLWVTKACMKAVEEARREVLEAKKVADIELYQARRDLLDAQDWVRALYEGGRQSGPGTE